MFCQIEPIELEEKAKTPIKQQKCTEQKTRNEEEMMKNNT